MPTLDHSLLTLGNFSPDVGIMILRDLRSITIKVKRVRKWYLVDKLTRAFIDTCFIMKLKTVKSFTLMRAIIKAIKELKEIISEETRLLKIGIEEAWKMSELASEWGHPSSRTWRNNKYFIIYQALMLKWISKLFGGITSK